MWCSAQRVLNQRSNDKVESTGKKQKRQDLKIDRNAKKTSYELLGDSSFNALLRSLKQNYLMEEKQTEAE